MNNQTENENLDLRNVDQSPVKIMISLIAVVLLAVLVWGNYYVNQLNRISGKPIDLNYIDTGLVWIDISTAKGTLIPGVNPDLILKPTPELIAKGKELYTTTCASCHGEGGEGNGPASGALNPKPRNYKQADGWTNGKKFSDLYKTLQEGIVSRGMTAYEFIKPEDRIAMIHYIRTTFGGFPDITEADVKTLEDNYSLSKGMKTANNIPVLTSFAKLSKENESKKVLIDSKAELIFKPESDNAKLAKSVTSCPKKAISFCLNSTEVLANKDNFVKLVSNSINQNGFNTKFLKLNNSDISELYAYFNSLVK